MVVPSIRYPFAAVDSGIPPMVDTVIKNFIAVVLYLILIGAVIHWFLIVAPIMMLVFGFVYMLFRVGARETKRLQNLSISPLLSHVTATIHGLASVRAYNKEGEFLTRYEFLMLFFIKALRDISWYPALHGWFQAVSAC